MIFASLDYRHYRERTGRFDAEKDAFAGLAHLGYLSDDILSRMQIGDCIFTQRLDSKLSWAMMWFTSSPIDHTAIYIGNGRIAHVTLAGFKEHSIRVLGRNTRILPFGIEPLISVPGSTSTVGNALPEPKKRPSHMLSPKAQLVWIAARIILGFHHERFRWKFVVDTLLVTISIETIICIATGLPYIPAFSSIVFMTAVFNRVKTLLCETLKKPQEVLSHPDIVYRSLMQNGCILFTTVGPIVVTDVGLLPLKVALRLYGESANDSPNDKL